MLQFDIYFVFVLNIFQCKTNLFYFETKSVSRIFIIFKIDCIFTILIFFL